MKAALFVTCLVDQLFPNVGEAAVKVLRHLNVEVAFPRDQTCCGQPALNSGLRYEATAVARRFLKVFEGSEYIVCPSGSCTSLVRLFYADLLSEDPHLKAQAGLLASRTYEFSEFITGVLKVTDIGARLEARVAYHDSCHSLRELGISRGPRDLIKAVQDVELVELPHHDVCCGFGGTFSIRYPEISSAILRDKVDNILKSGARILTATDSGCLMHINGALTRSGGQVEVLHLAELLARGLERADA
ncbi:MAG: (Fe-S)-binding protein [Chloroflexi bacterium]|nr:(Fe-S)-binding protein [Chloroflexota bacterium]